MVLDAMSSTRELHVRSHCGELGFVDVTEQSTLTDVRSSIENEWDKDMFPHQGFYFCVGPTRISKKQESRKRVWNIEGGDVISLHPTKGIEKPDNMNEANTPRAVKRPNMDHVMTSIVDSDILDFEESLRSIVTPQQLSAHQHELISIPKKSTFDRNGMLISCKTDYIQKLCKCKGRRVRTYCSCSPGIMFCKRCFAGHIQDVLASEASNPFLY